MDIYCKNIKQHAECTHPNILFLISNIKAKIKSKCAELLIDTTFFDKINDD